MDKDITIYLGPRNRPVAAQVESIDPDEPLAPARQPEEGVKQRGAGDGELSLPHRHLAISLESLVANIRYNN